MEFIVGKKKKLLSDNIKKLPWLDLLIAKSKKDKSTGLLVISDNDFHWWEQQLILFNEALRIEAEIEKIGLEKIESQSFFFAKKQIVDFYGVECHIFDFFTKERIIDISDMEFYIHDFLQMAKAHAKRLEISRNFQVCDENMKSVFITYTDSILFSDWPAEFEKWKEWLKLKKINKFVLILSANFITAKEGDLLSLDPVKYYDDEAEGLLIFDSEYKIDEYLRKHEFRLGKLSDIISVEFPDYWIKSSYPLPVIAGVPCKIKCPVDPLGNNEFWHVPDQNWQFYKPVWAKN